MDDLMEVKTFKQPDDGTNKGAIISLQRWEREIWRFVNGKAIEGYRNSPGLMKIFKDWIKFEQKIGSIEL